jgi:hypothetical protein
MRRVRHPDLLQHDGGLAPVQGGLGACPSKALDGAVAG